MEDKFLSCVHLEQSGRVVSPGYAEDAAATAPQREEQPPSNTLAENLQVWFGSKL
jgi:hypothetical protein